MDAAGLQRPLRHALSPHPSHTAARRRYTSKSSKVTLAKYLLDAAGLQRPLGRALSLHPSRIAPGRRHLRYWRSVEIVSLRPRIRLLPSVLPRLQPRMARRFR